MHRRYSISLVAITLGASISGGAALPQAIPKAPGTNGLVEVGLHHLRNLEFAPARQELEAGLSRDPNDLRALNALASVILQGEMFQRELLESRVYAVGAERTPADNAPHSPLFEQQLFGVLGKAEALANSRLKQNPHDEEALYWAGVTHATRAIYRLTMARAYVAALGEAKEAYNRHAQLLRTNPNFVDALLVVGMYDYIVGSLPWYAKFLASIAGHRGNKQLGLAAVERVTREGHWARADAKQFLAILYFREKRFTEVLPLLEDMSRSYPRNFLLPQEIARVYKVLGDWRSVARTYDDILLKHHLNEPGYREIPMAKILFQAGEAHTHIGENSKALGLFDQAARNEGNNIYVYRAELAAAELCRQQNRLDDARHKYERVAKAIPATDEGKAAQRSLRQFQLNQPASGK